jgi:predicted P-loop ATPase/GTPase
MLCKVLKLTSGDTVIGNVVEESRGYIEVHRPMRVVIVPKVLEENTFNLSMMKWDPLMNFTLPSRIFKQSIVSVSEATDDVLEVYTELYNQYEAGEQEENIVLQNRNKEFDSEEKVREEIDRMRALAIVSANTQTIH